MAKKIYAQDGVTVVGYEPGIIYALCYDDTPFYVGETHKPDQRLRDHQSLGRNPPPDAETKYQFINHLNQAGIAWHMMTLVEYGSEGPEAQEDECIMALLVEGYTLTNEKKGNANWMAERQAVAQDMRERGIRSYREYQQVMAEDAQQAPRDSRTQAQRERLEKIMTGIMGTAQQTRRRLDVLARRSQQRQQRQQALSENPQRQEAIADETMRLSERFPIEDQIRILQGAVLTFEQFGATESLRQRVMERLAFLQEHAAQKHD